MPYIFADSNNLCIFVHGKRYKEGNDDRSLLLLA